VKLYPLQVSRMILQEIARRGGFEVVAFTPDQLELQGGCDFGRPVLAAAAAVIIKMEKRRRSG